jgi:hypothetical protein
MSLYNISNKNLKALTPTTFAAEGLQERQDLQEALKGCIGAIAPDCLVISEEFSDWEDSRRRIDLLAIDKNANLVVIELKRDEVGAHMELQALRYAAMISTMTFDKACEYFAQYIQKEGLELNARETILDFVDLDESSLDDFGNDVRIVLASADFGKELTTSVLWLRDKGIDISCVRLTPYKYKDDVLIDASQIIPVPELEEYQVRFREKRTEQSQSRATREFDYSEYRFNGEVYNKRYLALALLTTWIEKHNPASLNAILETFNRSVRTGIAKNVEMIPEKQTKRFHINEPIELPSGETIAITNQWGLGNITRLVEFMSKDGIEVEKVD